MRIGVQIGAADCSETGSETGGEIGRVTVK